MTFLSFCLKAIVDLQKRKTIALVSLQLPLTHYPSGKHVTRLVAWTSPHQELLNQLQALVERKKKVLYCYFKWTEQKALQVHHLQYSQVHHVLHSRKGVPLNQLQIFLILATGGGSLAFTYLSQTQKSLSPAAIAVYIIQVGGMTVTHFLYRKRAFMYKGMFLPFP